jgi:vancomycin permeability regulator SanA
MFRPQSVVLLTQNVFHTQSVVLLTQNVFHTQSVVLLTQNVFNTQSSVLLTQNVFHTQSVDIVSTKYVFIHSCRYVFDLPAYKILRAMTGPAYRCLLDLLW